VTLYDQDSDEPEPDTAPAYPPDPITSPERMTPPDVAALLHDAVVQEIAYLLTCEVPRPVVRAGAEAFIGALRPGWFEVPA